MLSVTRDMATFELTLKTSDVPVFSKKFAALQKRAAKNGGPVPTWVEIQRIPGHADEKGHSTAHSVLSVTVENEADGYRFVARIEHAPGGNIIFTLGDKSIPEKYRTTSSTCDHCGLRRGRAATFVVERNGSFQQIGSSCLEMALGTSAAKLARAFDVERSIRDAAEESCGGGALQIDLIDFLHNVAALTLSQGFIGRAQAQESNSVSTADMALNSRTSIVQTDESRELAELALSWAQTMSDKDAASQYNSNLRAIALDGMVDYRRAGMAATIITGYRRDLEKFIAQRNVKADPKPSRYVGTLKKRMELRLRVQRVFSYDTPFGTSHIHIMADDKDNIFKWRTSSRLLSEGETYDIRGTVKDHVEYKGVKQTELTRCDPSLVEETTEG